MTKLISGLLSVILAACWPSQALAGQAARGQGGSRPEGAPVALPIVASALSGALRDIAPALLLSPRAEGGLSVSDTAKYQALISRAGLAPALVPVEFSAETILAGSAGQAQTGKIFSGPARARGVLSAASAELQGLSPADIRSPQMSLEQLDAIAARIMDKLADNKRSADSPQPQTAEAARAEPTPELVLPPSKKPAEAAAPGPPSPAASPAVQARPPTTDWAVEAARHLRKAVVRFAPVNVGLAILLGSPLVLAVGQAVAAVALVGNARRKAKLTGGRVLPAIAREGLTLAAGLGLTALTILPSLFLPVLNTGIFMLAAWLMLSISAIAHIAAYARYRVQRENARPPAGRLRRLLLSPRALYLALALALAGSALASLNMKYHPLFQTPAPARIQVAKDIDAAVEKATGYLLTHHGQDGSWGLGENSPMDSTYTRTVVTVMSLSALEFKKLPKSEEVISRGAQYLYTNIGQGSPNVNEYGMPVGNNFKLYAMTYELSTLLTQYERSSGIERMLYRQRIHALLDQFPATDPYYTDYPLNARTVVRLPAAPFQIALTGEALFDAKRLGFTLPSVGPKDIGQDSINALELSRANDGGFHYLLGGPKQVGYYLFGPYNGREDAVARDIIIEHLLFRAGANSEALRVAVDRFLKAEPDMRAILAGSEAKHTGPHNWAKYYYLFGIYWAARAIHDLPDPDPVQARRLADIILSQQKPGGYWVDSEFLGPEYGTALMIQALELLRDVIERAS